ncbi:MAG: gluconate:H+ symporter [Cyclobacteriaceae bacterium]|nr:gluconate:H+ symporter [Cyclobacteriaceae bacterium]
MITVIAISLGLLIGLILLRVNAFIAFLIASLAAGLFAGLEPLIVVSAIEKGLGNSLGSLVVILGFGAAIGKILSDSGAAQKISQVILLAAGDKYLPLAMMVIGFLVGIPLFFAVGFVILAPVLFSVAKKSALSPLYLGIPMVAALSVTHGLLPPHPAPVALVKTFGAAMDTTILYGFLIAIPAAILAGPFFSQFMKKVAISPLKLFDTPPLKNEELPSLTVSLFCALLPLLLLILPVFIPVGSSGMVSELVLFIAQPFITMVVSLIIAMYLLETRQGKDMKQIMNQFEQAFSGVAMILLIIAGAGAFSQVCSQIGLDEYISKSMADVSISPIFLCWIVAAGIRLAVGSATVAATATAGMLSDALAPAGVSPELLVLSTCAGSLIFSHLNDGGFWLFKEYFNMSIKQTLMTWSILETIIAVSGLAGCLILNMFI